MAGKTFRAVYVEIPTKARAQAIATKMQKQGRERVRITKKGKTYSVWAFIETNVR
jgi:hypothetical protein